LIAPVLKKSHPDGGYCIIQNSGIYWRIVEPAENGVEAPDCCYGTNLSPLLDREYRRFYVLWKVERKGKSIYDFSQPVD